MLDLSPPFIESLKNLQIVIRGVSRGFERGERTQFKKGSGFEFADHRPYTPGDDIRTLDWLASARVGRPIVKEYLEETDVGVTIIIDASSSMAMGSPPKIEYAKTLAYIFARIAIGRHERAGVAVLSKSQIACLPPRRGEAQINQIEYTIKNIKPDDSFSVSQVLSHYLSIYRQEGCMILISDLYDQEGFEKVIDCIGQVEISPWVVMITDDKEFETIDVGEGIFIDAETNEELALVASKSSKDLLYQEMLKFRREVKEYGARKGIPIIETEIHSNIETTIAYLAKQGLIVR